MSPPFLEKWPFVAEFIGTMLLVVLGDGVVANVLLTRSKGQNSGWMVITTGWALGVAVGGFIVGGVLGAHLHPTPGFGFAAPWAFSCEFLAGDIAAPIAVGASFAGVAV